MKKNLILINIAFLFLASCTKSVDNIITATTNGPDTQSIAAIVTNEFVKYIIFKGQQYCDKSTYETVKNGKLSFIVKFDSSAIYTIDKSNQEDINKLFGFSDNNARHHQYSARFGWRWSNNALRLFAYVYNNGTRTSKELGIIDIGVENSCSIKVSDSYYIFTLGGKSQTMPRQSITSIAEGYKLFPYFGGDEAAPHTISIWIKETIMQ